MSLILENLGHRFGDAPWLFRGLSRTLAPGKSCAVVGPSGSGKSTFLGLLAGWDPPKQGTVERKAGSVAWVFQNPTGVPRRTALDLVAFPYLAKGKDLRESERLALDNMARVGLRAVAERPFRSLSGGEAQRLMLARAMSIKPDLLLIDEPTAQLDRQTASTVNDAIQGLTMDGTITVIATHDSNTRQACDDVIDLALYAE